MKTLTRASLIASLVEKEYFSPHQAALLLEQTLEIMISALSAHEVVKIRGFGTFKTRAKKRRMGRNPKTKKEEAILPRRVLLFKASTFLKEKVQHQEDHELSLEELPRSLFIGP